MEQAKKQKRIERKREKEQWIVEEMIGLYCRNMHKDIPKEPCGERKIQDAASGRFRKQSKKSEVCLCKECRALLFYARRQSGKCPFMEQKSFCSNCKVHCYSKEMREKIRAVMRFSGPRMLFVHPIRVIWHMLSSAWEKRRLKKEEKAND